MLRTTIARTRLPVASAPILASLSRLSSSSSSSSSRHLSPLSPLTSLASSRLLRSSNLRTLAPPTFQSRFNSSSSNPSSSSTSFPPPPPPPPPAASLSLTARLKLLFKTHGWTALTLYLVFSFIDFSLTFLLVWSIGADRVREFEDWVLASLGWRRHGEGEKGVLRKKVDEWKEKHRDPEHKLHPVPEVGEVQGGKPKELGTTMDSVLVAGNVNGQEVGKKAKSGYSAYATTAVLAYAIHKTALLPVRVGLTVWVTPKVVRLLRSWGWNVGQMPATAAVASQAAAKKVRS